MHALQKKAQILGHEAAHLGIRRMVIQKLGNVANEVIVTQRIRLGSGGKVCRQGGWLSVGACIADEKPLCGLSAVDPGVQPVCTRMRVKNMKSNFCQNQPDPNSCDRLWQFNDLDNKVCLLANAVSVFVLSYALVVSEGMLYK